MGDKAEKGGNNYGTLTPKPGQIDFAYCGVCGTEMGVRRNFTHNNPQRNNPCDLFECPHLREQWHEQAVALKTMIRDTPSAAIAEILEKELQTVIAGRQPTKADWWR